MPNFEKTTTKTAITLETIVCEECGKELELIDAYEITNENHVCEACLEEKGYSKCEECGTYHPEKELTETVNGLVCEDCIEKEDYVQCRECGDWVFECDSRHDSCNHDDVCDSCFENKNFIVCEDCGEITEYYVVANKNSRYEIYVCESCADNNYEQCSDCGEYVNDRYTWASNDDVVICDSCSDNWYVCEDCERIESTDDIYYSESRQVHLCENCFNESEEESGLYGYSYKPSPIFHKLEEENQENALFMGLELEADNGDNIGEVVGDIHSVLDFTYCKKDSSLDNGLEIVSHPCTLQYHLSQKSNYKETFENMISNDWQGYDAGTAGYHIHINKNFFGENEDSQDLGIAKLMLLTNILWDNGLVNFTRRTNSQLNQWAKKCDILDNEDLTREEIEIIKECKSQRGRYYAINISNRNTIEFRLYRSTLNINTFIASLQFTSNIVNLVKETSLRDINKITMLDILNYNKYDELEQYYIERKLI